MNKSLDEVYIYLLQRTTRQFKKYSQAVLKGNDIDVTGDQWVIIKRISEQEGISQREVANLTYKDPASVTRILDLLEKKELVVRQAILSNRRTYALFLTKKGKELVEKVLPLAVDMRSKGLKGIKADDIAVFHKVLNLIYKNFE